MFHLAGLFDRPPAEPPGSANDVLDRLNAIGDEDGGQAENDSPNDGVSRRHCSCSKKDREIIA